MSSRRSTNVDTVAAAPVAAAAAAPASAPPVIDHSSRANTRSITNRDKNQPNKNTSPTIRKSSRLRGAAAAKHFQNPV